MFLLSLCQSDLYRALTAPTSPLFLTPPPPPPSAPRPSSLTSDSLANVVTARYGIKRRQGRKLSDQTPPMLRGYTADGPFRENRHQLSCCDLLILNRSDGLQKTDKVGFNCFIQSSISHLVHAFFPCVPTFYVADVRHAFSVHILCVQTIIRGPVGKKFQSLGLFYSTELKKKWG